MAKNNNIFDAIKIDKNNNIFDTMKIDDFKLSSVPERRFVKCDVSYKHIVGVNSFGHLNNQITLLAKANENMQQKYLDMLRPVPVSSDGTEDMSLRKAFDNTPSRYAQTPLELSRQTEYVSSINNPETPLETPETPSETPSETPPSE